MHPIVATPSAAPLKELRLRMSQILTQKLVSQTPGPCYRYTSPKTLENLNGAAYNR
jgi:hypothetical protein